MIWVRKEKGEGGEKGRLTVGRGLKSSKVMDAYGKTGGGLRNNAGRCLNQVSCSEDGSETSDNLMTTTRLHAERRGEERGDKERI